jgi:hypothetical protein
LPKRSVRQQNHFHGIASSSKFHKFTTSDLL